MTRIAHLSDLHFGRETPALIEALLALVAAEAPDVVVISGDLTQRARRWQFRAARAFIDRIGPPVLVVPGNHDVPLDNLLVRIFMPWRRYRRYIAADLEPVIETPDVVIVGVNTVNRWVWQQGRLSGRALSRLARVFAGAGERPCIAVMHHPLEHLPEWGKTPMRGAAAALGPLAEAGTDLVLCGHVHLAHLGPLTARPDILMVQAGTGISDRLRGAKNSVHIIDIAPGQVHVQTFIAAEADVFTPFVSHRFTRRGDRWAPEPG